MYFISISFKSRGIVYFMFLCFCFKISNILGRVVVLFWILGRS